MLDVYRLVVIETKPQRKCFFLIVLLARRVQCDGGLPACQKCSRAGRECQGYEMRLSWPRDDDKKRAIMGDLPQVTMRVRPKTNSFFINTTCRDVELYSHQPPQMEPLPGAEPSLAPYRQPELRASHMELLHYCKFETAPNCCLPIVLST